jgi:hypothetical protein
LIFHALRHAGRLCVCTFSDGRDEAAHLLRLQIGGQVPWHETPTRGLLQVLRLERIGDDGGSQKWIDVWDLIAEFRRTEPRRGERLH